MFQPQIATTHKSLNNIVSLELADQELKLRYRNQIQKYADAYILDVVNNIFSPSKRIAQRHFRDLLKGKKASSKLTGFKNAYQAVTVFEQSLRAEDDWNLLVRLNQLINKENPSIQDTNIRGGSVAEDEKILSTHEFADSNQVRHFTIELIRWYRKSETEVNKYIRIFTLIYHLLKTSPFFKNNFRTIMIALNFWLKENNILILSILPVSSMISKINDKDLPLNEFLAEILTQILERSNKIMFELEKQEIEANAPRKILNLSERQIEILKILQARDKITRTDAADILEVSFMTAYRDIKGLVRKRLLAERGIGRATYYVLTSRSKK